MFLKMIRVEIVWFGKFVKLVHIEISVVQEMFLKMIRVEIV